MEMQHNDGFIYVFGGQTSEEHVGLVERIDTQNGEIIFLTIHIMYGTVLLLSGKMRFISGVEEVKSMVSTKTRHIN